MHTALRRLLSLLILAPGLALAHPSPDHALSFASGISHPFSGLDHLLAMIAVGMLGARLKDRAVWILPLTFMFMLTIGALVGIGEAPSPIVEITIATSIIAFGILLAIKQRVSIAASAVVVSTFALAHGYAHGVDAVAGNDFAYLSGMLVASAMLHAMGIGAVLTMIRTKGESALRFTGIAFAIVGAGMMLG